MSVSQLKKELLQVLEHSEVIDDEAAVSAVNTATFRTHAGSKLIVRIASVPDLSTLLSYAASHGLKVYVISRGKNWGFGSRAPVHDTDLLIDLSAMNKILHYDRQFGTVRIEPGVTFLQLTQFLRENGNHHFLNTIGGDPQASVLGNLLERGDGIGPYCERSEYACAPEVILADGSCIELGFQNVKHSKLAGLCRHGIGPGLQELFIQSNYGIVTKMTLWLCQAPRDFRTFHFQMGEKHDLSTLLDRIRPLYQRRILTSPITFWNDFKQLANAGQYPWHLNEQGAPLRRSAIRPISNNYCTWMGFGGIYVDHVRIGRHIQKEIDRAIRGNSLPGTYWSRLSSKKIRIFRWLNRLLRHTPLNLEALIALWEHNPLLGQPTNNSIRSLYWRKKTPPPQRIDPDLQGCGVLWNSFLIPFSGSEIARAIRELEAIIQDEGFEPVFSFITLNDRYIRFFQQLIFDRHDKDADDRALICHRKVFHYLESAGYTHSRLDILNMQSSGSILKDSSLQKSIKLALDPLQVIAPGRYFI